MADPEDYEYVLAGNTDLVGCVLDGANFSGMNLSGRNFQGTRITGANFSGANLSGVSFLKAGIAHANFNSAKLTDCKFDGSIFGLNFEGADLRNSTFSGLLNRCDFSGANLSGAKFLYVTLSELCNFDDALFDDQTSFLGARALRPYLRFPILARYDLSRGVLVPREPMMDTAQKIEQKKAIEVLKTGIWELSRVVDSSSDAPSVLAGFGHNNPPEEFRISKDDFEDAQNVFQDAIVELDGEAPKRSKLDAAAKLAVKIARVTLAWIAQKADIAANEFVKSVGGTLGSKTALFVGALTVSGAMEAITEILKVFVR